MSYVNKKGFEDLYEYITDQCFSEEEGITSLLKVQKYIYDFIDKYVNLDNIITLKEGIKDE